MSKCFCHFNGYEVKDAAAREGLDLANARLGNMVANSGEQTEGNLELIDIRTGADGTVYQTAGDSVREQITDLKSDLSKVTDKGLNMFDKDNYLVAKTNDEYLYIEERGYCTASSFKSGEARMVYVEIEPNTTYTVKKDTVTVMRVGTFINEPLTNMQSTSFAVHSSASSEALTVMSGPNDRYLAVQLFVDSDTTGLKTIAANINNLVIVEGSEIPSFTGLTAVDKVARERLDMIERRNVVILSDYAVGDGVSDDTNAVNLALSKAENGILLVPKGEYLVSSTIKIKGNTTIIGCGTASIIKLADSYQFEPYEWRPHLGQKYQYRHPFVITDVDSENCIIENLCICGQTSAYVDENEDGLCIRGNNHIVRNIVVRDINHFPDTFTSRNCITPGYGILTFNADTVTVENCHAYNCGYEGFGVENSKNIVITGCKCGLANQTGIQVHANSEHIRITNNSVVYEEGMTRPSLTFDADTTTPMNDIYVDGNWIFTSTQFVAGGENNVRLTNNYMGDGIYCHNSNYRNGTHVRGNIIKGKVSLYSDNAIITENNIEVNDGYIVMLRGNNGIVTNNVGSGTAKETLIETH